MPRWRQHAQSDGELQVVIDTNVPIAGLLWHGRSHAVLTQVRGGALGVPTINPAQALQRVCSG